jgi:hypothetical protein
MTGSGAKRPFARVQMLALSGHDLMSGLSPLLDEQRTTYARYELFRF